MGKSNRFENLFLFLLFGMVLSGITLLNAQEIKEKNKSCLRCHAMETLSYHDSITGSIVSLSVNPEKYSHSVHKRLNCTDCHTNNGYKNFPHGPSIKSEKLSCMSCHQDDKKFRRFHFKKKEKEFKASVHYKNLNDEFTCSSCHNPHDFGGARAVRNVSKRIKIDNQICMNCHQSGLADNRIARSNSKDLLEAHNWLPKTKLHWKSVRCVECHTAQGKEMSHTVLPKEEAVKKCESCHSKNAELLNKLYNFRKKQNRGKNGIFASIFYDTPYVIGLTRNLWLDRLSIIIFIFMIFVLGAHGFGRWLGNRRSK
jgi:hypothetical protein